MMKLAWTVALALAGSLALSTWGCDKPKTVISVAAEDAEMNAAITAARATLPEFWRILESPQHGETNFALKVEISDSNGTEHFWATDIQRIDGRIRGIIGNEPEVVASVKEGQTIEIPEADISDWLYIRDGKMHGNRTLRAMFKNMPANEAEKLKAIMADP